MSNEEPPDRIVWRGLRFKKSAIPYNGRFAKYDCELGSGDVKLWMWNLSQWGASIDGASYSVANSYDEALTSAALKAIDYHEYHRGRLFDLLDQDDDE